MLVDSLGPLLVAEGGKVPVQMLLFWMRTGDLANSVNGQCSNLRIKEGPGQRHSVS